MYLRNVFSCRELSKKQKKKKQKAILKERDRDKNQAAIVGSFKSKIW